MSFRSLALVFLVAVAGSGVAQAADFNVTATSASAYTINGASNPPLALTRGQTYTFAVNSPGHPFFIKTAQVTGTGSAYNNGITNNGITSGTLTFVVPMDAPATLYYQCSIHTVMTAAITIAGAPAPATTPMAIGGFALLLLTGAWLVLRRRAVQVVRD